MNFILQVYNTLKLIAEEKLTFFNIWTDDVLSPSVLIITTVKDKCDVWSLY